MFLCISPNPAIDKRVAMKSLIRGQVNRASGVQGFPGGKSAHVAMVLHTLGAKPHWIGPYGGASGQELVAGLSALGIQATGFPSPQPTRTNLEIVEEDGTVTEILEPGSTLGPKEWDAFESAYRKLLSSAATKTTVIFSGSLPAGTPTDLYARFIAVGEKFQCRTFVDASGEALREALRAKPCFVKPNCEEASQLLGKAVNSMPQATDAIRKLLELGARSAALSLGPEGLLFCPGVNAPVLFAPAPVLKPRSTVGCGDSALAGFAFGIASNFSPSDTLQLAAACAAANCLADSPGAARSEDIRDFQRQISVEVLASKP
jgi:1-phosphofructokinase family hexose kinase